MRLGSKQVVEDINDKLKYKKMPFLKIDFLVHSVVNYQ